MPVRQACTFAYYADDGQKLGVAVGMTVNVSENGMMLSTDKWVQPGMRLLVEVVSQMYMFMATAHVIHAEELGDTLYQLGIEYEQVIQSDWSLVPGHAG